VKYNQLTQKPVTDPATDEELGTVPEMGLEDAKSAIAAAGKAFASWGKTTARVGILYLLLA
jgi:acyl-CoA reductase-like NAD-dependent aldehyde dehydrogenase